MTPPRIGIFTIADDFHALVIKKALEDVHGVSCSIVETDRLCGHGDLTWSNGNTYRPRLATAAGDRIDVGALALIWWRRGNVSQDVPRDVTDPAHVDLISNDCHFALLGLLLDKFHGAWVSNPQATLLAQNKLLQLRAAKRTGFRVPRTLVSQEPEEIRRFCAALGNRVVVKVVKGTVKGAALTTMVNPEMLEAESCLRLCPAIYQELIPGDRHLRICCFGDTVYAALIESEDLDWRANLKVPVRPFDLSADLDLRLRRALRVLGLRMGIFDLKLNEQGEAVWLEVNPQGQFLFLEGLCGLPLTSAFAAFLSQEAVRSRRRGPYRTGDAVREQ